MKLVRMNKNGREVEMTDVVADKYAAKKLPNGEPKIKILKNLGKSDAEKESEAERKEQVAAGKEPIDLKSGAPKK